MRLISEGEANFLATRPMLLTIVTPDIHNITHAQLDRQVKLSELVRSELFRGDQIGPIKGPERE